MVKVYTETLPEFVKKIHEHNDKYYEAPPLHPALIIQDSKTFTTEQLQNIADQLKQVTQTTIRIAGPKKLIATINNAKIVSPFPFWARILNKIPFFASASYGAIDFKNLGNFVVSIGTGPNLFMQPLLTTFHIAILTDFPKPKSIIKHALVRPEIVIIYNKPEVFRYVTSIRKTSLGKPTLLINGIQELSKIFRRALNIYNKMPFRWVDKLRKITK